MEKIEMEVARDILIAALQSDKHLTLNNADGKISPELLGDAYSTILNAVRSKDK